MCVGMKPCRGPGVLQVTNQKEAFRSHDACLPVSSSLFIMAGVGELGMSRLYRSKRSPFSLKSYLSPRAGGSLRAWWQGAAAKKSPERQGGRQTTAEARWGSEAVVVLRPVWQAVPSF